MKPQEVTIYSLYFTFVLCPLSFAPCPLLYYLLPITYFKGGRGEYHLKC
jgi:hypothetical protein